MSRLSCIFFLAPILFALSAVAAPPPLPEAPRPFTILSIIPAQAEPGMTVTLNGSGFTDRTVAFLGANEVRSAVVGDKVLTLTVPDLQPGVYALYLRREDGATSRPYNFTVQAVRPDVTSVSPDRIDACATGRDREVSVNGSNFKSGAQVLFDGAAIGTRYLSGGSLAILTPQLPAGLHQVVVKNPSGASSDPVALVIDSKPEISAVSIGSDFVSYYEMIISGRNFQQGSTLVVDGARIRTGNQVATEREALVFVGCTQLIYQRHPYDSTLKELRVQVVNPNGEESGVILVTAP